MWLTQDLTSAHDAVRILGTHPIHCTVKKNSTYNLRVQPRFTAPKHIHTSTSHFGFHHGSRQLLCSSDALIRFSLSKSGHLIYKQNRIWKLLWITAEHTTVHLTLYNHRVFTPGCSRQKHPLTMPEDPAFRCRRTSDQRSIDLLCCFERRPMIEVEWIPGISGHLLHQEFVCSAPASTETSNKIDLGVTKRKHHSPAWAFSN